MDSDSLRLWRSLDYCGFASIRDFEDHEWQKRLADLEARDLGELRCLLNGWFSHWSRVWEFPFVYNAVVSYVSRFNRPARILEAGSGVTPLPFWLGGLGHVVVGVDLDSRCASKWDSDEVPCRPDPQSTRLIVGDMEQLPIRDGSFDVVYSVSALEHVRRPVQATIEMCRAVRPRGLLVLTYDVEVIGSGRGDNEGLPKTTFYEIQRALADRTTPLYPPMWFSPNELLTFENRRAAACHNTTRKIRRLVGKSLTACGLRKRVDVAIFGAVLQRRSSG